MAGSVEDRLAHLETRLHQMEEAYSDLRRARIGLSIEKARAKLDAPAERGTDTVAKLQRVFGRFDGPADLSEHFREYLAGECT
ncbi:MAG: hypothetical protein ACRDI2_10215 [Chloroflexota bacterium]